MTVLAWSSPILLVDEVLKFVGRRLQAKAKQAKAEGKQEGVRCADDGERAIRRPR